MSTSSFGRHAGVVLGAVVLAGAFTAGIVNTFYPELRNVQCVTLLFGLLFVPLWLLLSSNLRDAVANADGGCGGYKTTLCWKPNIRVIMVPSGRDGAVPDTGQIEQLKSIPPGVFDGARDAVTVRDVQREQVENNVVQDTAGEVATDKNFDDAWPPGYSQGGKNGGGQDVVGEEGGIITRGESFNGNNLVYAASADNILKEPQGFKDNVADLVAVAGPTQDLTGVAWKDRPLQGDDPPVPSARNCDGDLQIMSNEDLRRVFKDEIAFRYVLCVVEKWRRKIDDIKNWIGQSSL